MQKVLPVIRIKTGMDVNIHAISTAETNDISRFDSIAPNGKNGQTVNIVPVVSETMREHKQAGFFLYQLTKGAIPNSYQNRTLLFRQGVR